LSAIGNKRSICAGGEPLLRAAGSESIKMTLPRTFHIGGYWRGPNDMVRQMMLGLKAAGAEVFEYNTDLNCEALDCGDRTYDRGRFGPVWLRWESLGPAIEEFRPDLIVCNAGGLSFPPETARLLRRSTMMLGIALSDPDVFAASTSRIASNFDLFLTNAAGCLAEYRAMGVNADLLPLATNEEFFHPVAPRAELACEVLVVGQAHSDRIDPVRCLCRQFDVHLYGEGWEAQGLPSRGTLYGDDLLAALNSARISVIFSRTPAGHAIGKVAIFDFIAGGGLVATEFLPELEHYFDYGEELIGFTGTDELVAKIGFYLAHPRQAQAIREAGRTRVLSEHVWRRVWPLIVERLRMLRAPPCGV
jgi:spore maturation protein CgeB